MSHAITFNARRRLLTGSAVAAIALASAAAAAAQPATGQIEEVVVTAQKKVERLQDVPASVAVVNAEAMAAQGQVRFTDYAAQVPGMSLTTVQTGKAQVTLRGITTGPAQSASATSFYVDEAPVGSVNAYTTGSQTTPDLDPADLARIEVLKGPQGTLYGAGAVGGLVKFVTASPDLSKFSGRVSAGVSDVKAGESGYSLRGLVNIPLVNDRLALRVSGFTRTDPGFIDNTVGNKKDINSVDVRGGRIVLAGKLNDDVRMELSAIGQETRSDGFNVMDVSLATLAPLYGDLKVRRYRPEPARVGLNLYNLKTNVNAGNVALISSTTYQVVKSKVLTDTTDSFGAALSAALRVPNLGVYSPQFTKTERFSQEFRADTTVADGKLDLQGGLYFTHEKGKNYIPAFEPFSTVTNQVLALPNIVTASIISRYTEYSGFANATWHVSDKLDLLGGVRYAYDRQHYLQDYAGLLVGPRRVNISGEKDKVATWLLSPRYKFDEDHMVYARLATGYRPGGPNATPPPAVAAAPATFAPDKLTSYELGYKASYLDRTLSVDAALFYTDWKDIQIQTSAGGFNFFVNGGAATSKGGEITLKLRPATGLVLGLNGSYIDATLSEAAPAAGGLNGDRLPFVPKWSGSLSADYNWPLGDGLNASVGATVAYMGERMSDYTAAARLGRTVPSFTTVNLRAGVEKDAWSLTAYAKNIGDERGILALSSRNTGPNAASPYNAGLIAPRTIGAEIAYRF